MKTTKDTQAGSLKRMVRRLDAAHAELVEARKIAALSKHESYEEIGDAIECVEAAFVWLHKSPDTRTETPPDSGVRTTLKRNPGVSPASG